MKSDFKGVIIPSHYRGNIGKVHPLRSLAQELVIRGFSKRTVKAYLGINQRFLAYIGKSAREVSCQDVKDYLLYLKLRGQSNTSLNLTISALKFYFQEVLKRKLFFNISRPRKEKYLPVVLAKEEILKLIGLTSNLKHQLLLSLMYGSGLRVSEAVALKVGHLDLNSFRVLVKSGKGAKDRWTVLSKKSLELLNGYLPQLPMGQDYLFAGVKGRVHLSQRSAQKVFRQAMVRAGINKPAGCHSLRHSFATHLLGRGIELNLIQKLLGHENIKTTQIYARVSDRAVSRILSPLD